MIYVDGVYYLHARPCLLKRVPPELRFRPGETVSISVLPKLRPALVVGGPFCRDESDSIDYWYALRNNGFAVKRVSTRLVHAALLLPSTSTLVARAHRVSKGASA